MAKVMKSLKLWRDNRVDGEWEAPVTDVIQGFRKSKECADWLEHGYRPFLFYVAWYVGDPKGLNSVWDTGRVAEIEDALWAEYKAQTE